MLLNIIIKNITLRKNDKFASKKFFKSMRIRFITVVKIKKEPLKALFSGWSHQDLNLGPSDYESDALTN